MENDSGATTSLLDEAFERMAGSDFELPNGFVNHGPMACEALAVLGREDLVDSWARRSADMTGEGPAPVPPLGGDAFDWQDALGRYERLPEWLGYFAATIGDEGWRAVVARWVPRLVPALSTALFHGAIRTAHAVRAVDAADTQARRSELARAFGYWAARYHPGAAPDVAETGRDVIRAVTGEAATGAHHYLAAPNIFNLHGVTGAMAVELLTPHLRREDAVAALAQVRADHAAMYAGAGRAEAGAEAGARVEPRVIELAAASDDPHQVKLVEACRRGLGVNGDPVFAAAASEVVSGRG
jgi:Questin oxidase-like